MFTTFLNYVKLEQPLPNCSPFSTPMNKDMKISRDLFPHVHVYKFLDGSTDTNILFDGSLKFPFEYHFTPKR